MSHYDDWKTREPQPDRRVLAELAEEYYASLDILGEQECGSCGHAREHHEMNVPIDLLRHGMVYTMKGNVCNQCETLCDFVEGATMCDFTEEGK
jgi:hypothetical protein